ncbi:MAG: hypothetical protein ACR2MY_03105 [Candidatus Dormibacteria bacterium]
MDSSGSGLPPGAGTPLVAGTPQSLIAAGPGRPMAYLYGRKNLLATGTAVLVGIVLATSGVVGLLWPVVVAGVYLVAALAIPAKRHRSLRSGSEPDDVRRALAAQVRALGGKVPNDIYARVASIQASILALLPRVEHLPAGSEDLYIVQRTALEYLPAALESYLNLPRAYATLHPVESGRTPSQVLVAQLDVLEVKLSEISDDIAAGDSDRLLANGRFLREKFGRSELEPPA